MYEIKENSIELWAIEAEKLFKQDQNPMSDELSKTFITCCMSEQEMEQSEDIREKLSKKELGLCSVFYNRVKYCHTYEASIALCLFMGLASESFGEVTIYANYLQYQANKHNMKRIDMGFIGEKVFPMGLPSRETLNKVWDMQKVKRESDFDSDNLLDIVISSKKNKVLEIIPQDKFIEKYN